MKAQTWLAVALVVILAIDAWQLARIAALLADAVSPKVTPTPEVLAVQSIYVHGLCRAEDATTVRGAVVSLWQSGRQVGSSLAASGAWGMSVSYSGGPWLLRVDEPLGRVVVGMVKPPNVTGWQYDGGASVTFDLPTSGTTGDIIIYFASLVTPTVPKTGTLVPTLSTPTPYAPTPTFTPQPVTPSPTWTPGPTPTMCFRAPPPELVTLIKQAMERQQPLGDSDLTRMALRLALGWPMIAEEAGEVNGERFTARLFSQFAVLVRWDDGCYSVIDAGTLTP